MEYNIDNIVNSISDCLMIVDNKRIIRTANTKLEEYLKLEKHDLIGHIMCDFFPFYNNKNIKVCPLIDALDKEESLDFSYENYKLKLNGSTRLVDGRVELIKQNEKITGAIISFKDITEAVETKEKLLDSENKFRSLYNAMVSSYTLRKVIYDDNGEPYDYMYLEVNPAYEQLIGKKRSEIIGKTYRELFPQNDKFWTDSFNHVTKKGESKTFEGYVPAVDKYLRTHVFMVTEDLSGFIATDISKQKELEKLLAEERELFKQLFTTMENGYALYELKGDKTKIDFKFIEANPTFLKFINKERAEVIGKNASEIFKDNPIEANEESKKMLPAYYEAAVNKKTQRFDIYSNLMGRHIEVIAYGQGDNKFAVEYIDITERKKLQESLKQEKDKYSKLFNSMNEGLILLETVYDSNKSANDLKILDINFRGEEILKADSEKIIGLRASTFFEISGYNKELSMERLLNIYNLVNLSSDSKKSGIVMEAFNKTLNVSAFKPSDDTLAILFKDVTQQYELERQIKEERELLDLVFNESLSAFAIIEMIYDDKGIPVDYMFTKVNPKFLEIGDKSEKDIIGIKASQLYDIDIYRKESMFHDYVKVVKTGKPVRKEFLSLAYNKYLDITVTKVKDSTLAIFFSDITEKKAMQDKLHDNVELLKKSQEELSKSEAMFRAILSNTTDAILIYDKNLKVIFRSDNVEKILGWTKKDLSNMDGFSLLHPEDKEQVQDYMKQMISEGLGGKIEFEARVLTKSGDYIYTKNSMLNMLDDPDINGLLINYSDITEMKNREKEIVYLSNYDALTGLYNRSYFERNFDSIDSNSNLPLSVIMGDLNGLKLINDMLGHQKGDEILIRMADIIKSSCKNDHIPIRYGGDEYCIVMPNTTFEEAQSLIEQLKKKCQNYKNNEQNEIFHFSIALGCATKETQDKDLAEVLKKAEDLMYKDKLFEGRSVHSATSLVSSIKAALHEKSFETEEHSARLAKYSRRVGKKFNLLNYQLNELSFAAELHDIGKIGVDDRILVKKDKLTKEELEKVKEHPEIGYRIAKASPELSSIADYILYHHERWDGTGYPFGLSKYDIPLYSRIIAVVDAYDVMTSGRPYKSEISHDNAVVELINNKRTQFDPRVVDIFINEVINK